MLQAEDGIRDLTVTGVQTCALPISAGVPRRGDGPPRTGATGGILEPDGPARNRPRARRAARSPPRHRIAARPRPARGRSLGTADAGPGYRPLRGSGGARARARHPAPRACEPALLAARADGARCRVLAAPDSRWLTRPSPSRPTIFSP